MAETGLPNWLKKGYEIAKIGLKIGQFQILAR
jgi:hypothetical protein